MENILETIDSLQNEGRLLIEKIAFWDCIALSKYMDKVEKAGGSRRKALEILSEYLPEQFEYIDTVAKQIEKVFE